MLGRSQVNGHRRTTHTIQDNNKMAPESPPHRSKRAVQVLLDQRPLLHAGMMVQIQHLRSHGPPPEQTLAALSAPRGGGGSGSVDPAPQLFRQTVRQQF